MTRGVKPEPEGGRAVRVTPREMARIYGAPLMTATVPGSVAAVTDRAVAQDRADIIRSIRDELLAQVAERNKTDGERALDRYAAEDRRQAEEDARLGLTETWEDQEARREPVRDDFTPLRADLLSQAELGRRFDPYRLDPHRHPVTGKFDPRTLPPHKPNRPSQQYEQQRVRTIRAKANRLGITYEEAEAMTPRLGPGQNPFSRKNRKDRQ